MQDWTTDCGPVYLNSRSLSATSDAEILTEQGQQEIREQQLELTLLICTGSLMAQNNGCDCHIR